MKNKVLTGLLAFFFMTSFLTNGHARQEGKDSITVYIFLHEDCLISQYYTLPLKELHQTYSDQNIQFVGLFPNLSSKLKSIKAFKEKYKIPFELKTDHYHIKTSLFGATVTPEVVVYNETQEEILYKGRIDDTYARVGKRRRVSSKSELREVLESISNDKPILVENANAVGCFINKKKRS